MMTDDELDRMEQQYTNPAYISGETHCGLLSYTAQQDVPALIAEVLHLRAANAMLRELVAQANQFSGSKHFGIEHAIECAEAMDGDECDCGFTDWRARADKALEARDGDS
jgi:hypothetical protein